MKKVWYLIGVSMYLSACSSIVNDKTQVVSVDTPACPAATCKLSNADGQYFINQTPGTVMVNKSTSDLTIECSKENLKSIEAVKSSVNASMFGNLLFGGVIGAAIDAGSGAGFDYPTTITNGLSCAK